MGGGSVVNLTGRLSGCVVMGDVVHNPLLRVSGSLGEDF